MAVYPILNNETGGSVRNKLNKLIDTVNYHLLDRYFYRALVQQTGTNPPVEIVRFDQSLSAIAGNFTWVRAATGIYVFETYEDVFSPNNCYFAFHYAPNIGGAADVKFRMRILSENSIEVESYLNNNPSDNILRGFVEIVLVPGD